MARSCTAAAVKGARRAVALEPDAGGQMLVPALELVRELDGDDGRVNFLVVVREGYGRGAAAEHAAHGDLGEEVGFGGVLGNCWMGG